MNMLAEKRIKKIADMTPFLNKDEMNEGWSIIDDKEQFRKGLEIGKNAKEIHISVNNVWNTINKDGSSTNSYERIGYHRGTISLLRGFLKSKKPIFKHYWTEEYGHIRPYKLTR